MENTAPEMIWRQIGDKIDTQISWHWKHFFASKIVFRVIVCCLRGVGSMSSSRRIPRFIVLFSSGYCWLFFVASLGLMSSLRHFYAFVSTGLPFVNCATYFGRYLMYGDIHCTDFTCISYTSYMSYKLYLPLFPCYSVVIFFISVYFCMTNHNIFSLIDAFFCGSKVVVEWFALQIGLRSE